MTMVLPTLEPVSQAGTMSSTADTPKAPIPDWLRQVNDSADKIRQENERSAAIKEAMGESTPIDGHERK